jgi:hypothetical protein
MARLFLILPLVLVAGACDRAGEPEADRDTADVAGPTIAANAEAPSPPAVDAPAPGTAGGLPDERAPIREGPFSETSAQGAANVAQSYHGLIEQRRFGEAWRLWSDGGRASGMSEEAFARGFDRYSEYHAEIGAPGRIEGAAGTLYVEVPVVVYGRMRNGREFRMSGAMTLRRANEVPGSTAEQRRWRIASTEMRPGPRG